MSKTVTTKMRASAMAVESMYGKASRTAYGLADVGSANSPVDNMRLDYIHLGMSVYIDRRGHINYLY